MATETLFKYCCSLPNASFKHLKKTTVLNSGALSFALKSAIKYEYFIHDIYARLRSISQEIERSRDINTFTFSDITFK